MNISQKQMDQFIRYIPQLEPQEFVGLARLLGVEVVDTSDIDFEQLKDEEYRKNLRTQPRDFNDVLEDMLAAFQKTNRKRRREIMSVLSSATKKNNLDAAGAQDEHNDMQEVNNGSED